MKSAYELALERLEKQGIERPDESKLTDLDRQKMAEARSKAEARLAEVEILFRDRLAKTADPAKRREEEEHYQLDRRRIESERDQKLEQVRRSREGT
jgi:hypothetical protein